MDKKEFLEILRQSLTGEVKPEIVEQNIKYYDEYINAQTAEEMSKIMEMLGGPRLIAKTIIEAERAAKQKNKYTSYQGAYTNNTPEEEETKHEENDENSGRNIFRFNMKWYQKVTIALILLVTLIAIAFLGRLLIGFIFAFGLPIILVLLALVLIRKR